MKSKTLIALLISLLSSCSFFKSKQYENDIVGEWIYAKTDDYRVLHYYNGLLEPPTLFEKRVNGFIFYKDKSCENKLGYYRAELDKTNHERRIVYLGNKTKYKFENDSLKIWDISDSTWQSLFIYSIIGDTMTIKTADSCFHKYTRTKYNIDTNERYDNIVVSSSGCYGYCPVMDIRIDKSGDVLFFGERFNTQYGFYSSKISKQEYQNIETNFKKADIKNLNERYYSEGTDRETISILFIKNDSIVKSIEDYGGKSPIELIWAYTPLRFLYQNIKLTPLKSDNPKLNIRDISIKNGDNICSLSKAESYFLATDIYRGKITSRKLELKYKIEYWNAKRKKEIGYTDGQFYKIGVDTIDIGHNFLAKNKMTIKFNSEK